VSAWICTAHNRKELLRKKVLSGTKKVPIRCPKTTPPKVPNGTLQFGCHYGTLSMANSALDALVTREQVSSISRRLKHGRLHIGANGVS